MPNYHLHYINKFWLRLFENKNKIGIKNLDVLDTLGFIPFCLRLGNRNNLLTIVSCFNFCLYLLNLSQIPKTKITERINIILFTDEKRKTTKCIESLNLNGTKITHDWAKSDWFKKTSVTLVSTKVNKKQWRKYNAWYSSSKL